MAKKVYFRDGALEVNSDFVKARTRSIQLSTLESVQLHRSLFLGTVGICGGLMLFGVVFFDLLYLHEVALALAIGGGLLWLSWNLGTFTVHSKLTGAKGWSVTWWMRPLKAMRSAVETALEDQVRNRRSRKAGAVTYADNDDEEEEASDEAEA